MTCGGPAGLSAALILGRCCRKVALIDAGHPRNAASGGMHGYLSRDGTPPGEFLQTNREQLQKYPGVECFSGTATNCQRLEDGFEVHSGEGGLFRSKLLLLATGLVDPLPPVEGVEAFYGKTIHHSNKSN